MSATPPTQPQFERLFTPLKVGPMTVPNRICETTNTIRSAQMPGFVDEPFIAHHLAKAKGGTGWIGSETFNPSIKVICCGRLVSNSAR